MFCTIWRSCSGKRNPKPGRAVTAACQGKLSACRMFGISGLTHTMQHTMKRTFVDSSRYEIAHVDAREGKWRGKWRMEWVASTLHTTSEHGVSSITTADAQTWAASSRLNWRSRRFKWPRPFRRKMKSGFCACDITFQLASTKNGGSTLCWNINTTLPY